MSSLTLEQQATNAETQKHIRLVGKLLNIFVRAFLDRAENHDSSKLESPELELFTEFTPKLSACTYGSQEYTNFRKEMGVALDHHYARNRHHPEHYAPTENRETAQLALDIQVLQSLLYKQSEPDREALSRLLEHLNSLLASLSAPLNNMTLVDFVEMLCDWKASSMRHNNGNILKSIDINMSRFGISPQLAQLMRNTVELFENVRG